MRMQLVAGHGLLACLLLTLSAGHLAGANPGNKDFDAALAVHGKESRALQTKAQALYEEANKSILTYIEAGKKNRLDRLDVRPIGQTAVQIAQLRRAGERLRILGESAGIDYGLRATALDQTLSGMILVYRQLPAAQKRIDQIRLQLRKQAPARAKHLEKLERLAGEGEWPTAEDELYKLFDLLESGAVFLSDAEQRALFQPFGAVAGAINTAMQQLRQRQAQELFAQRRQEQAPPFRDVLAEMAAWEQSLASTGTVVDGDQELTGPQLMARVMDRWAEVQVAAIRCQTLDWLIRGADAPYGSDYTATEDTKNPLAADYEKFTTSYVHGVARLIDADASRVSEAEAMQLYLDYLPALAPLLRRSLGPSVAAVLQPPLERLAAKAPQFPAAVSAYNEATGDLLRWRQRVSRALAANKLGEFPPIEERFRAATKSDANYTGLFPAADNQPQIPTLLASAPQVLPRPIQQLIGQKALALDVVRLPRNGPAAIARYRMRTFVNVPSPLDLAAELDALKFDLLVGDQAPPLTLAAALAIDTAERGDLVAVGGEIENLYLESVASRFGALPVAAWVLTVLGRLPQEQQQYDFPAHVLMRFDFAPRWAQHDFFFVEFPPAEAE